MILGGKIMKYLKQILFCAIFICATALGTAQNFYSGDGGKGKKFVVGESILVDGASNKSDASLPSKIKDDFAGSVATYSAIEIADEADNEANKKRIAKSEGNEYESSLEANFIQTDKRITIKTTRMASGKYQIQIMVKSITKGTTEMSFSVPEMSFEDAQKKGGVEAATIFFERYGVELTAAGKESLLPGSVLSSSSSKKEEIEVWQQTIAAQNAQSAKLEQELQKLRAQSALDAKIAVEIARKEAQQKKAQAQAQQAQERLARLQEQAKADALAEEKRKELDKKYLAQIDEIQARAEEIARQNREKSASVLSAQQKIENIELNKQSLTTFWKEITDGIAQFNRESDKALIEEIESKAASIRQRFPRMVDKNGFFVDERIMIAFLNDIQSTQDQNAKKKTENQWNQLSMADSIKNEISNYIKDLETSEYEADSLIHSTGLFLSFSPFNSTTNSWNYTLTLYIGNENWSRSGVFTYKEITGKEPPKIGALLNELEEFENEVGKYEIMLNTGSPIIRAQLKYKILVGENSKYQIEMKSLLFSDIEQGKILKSEYFDNSNKYKEIQYTPATTVNLMTAQEILNAKAAEQKQVNSKLSNLQSGRKVVPIQGGTFKMGREGGADNEKPIHEMTVDDFEMLSTEVTNGLYYAVMGKYNKSSTRWYYNEEPVTNITLFEAIEFCNKLSEVCGLNPAYTITKTDSGRNFNCNFIANGFRLPTETEWEYAALGGMYNAEYTIGNPYKIPQDEWNSQNSPNSPQNVAKKSMNILGLYDMYGNVSEWCWDTYASNAYEVEKKYGPTDSHLKNNVFRGGAFTTTCRSPFYRNGVDPNKRFRDIGFRVIRPTGLDVEILAKKNGASSNFVPPSPSRNSASYSGSSSSFFSNLSTQERVSDAFGIGYAWIGNDRFSANGAFVNFTSFHKGPVFFDIGDIILAGKSKEDGYKSGSVFFAMGPRLGLYKGIKRLFLDVHAGAGIYLLSYPEKSSSSDWDSGYDGYSKSSSKDDFSGGFYLKMGVGTEFKFTDHFKATFGYDVYFTFGGEPVAADNIRIGICFGQPVY